MTQPDPATPEETARVQSWTLKVCPICGNHRTAFALCAHQAGELEERMDPAMFEEIEVEPVALRFAIQGSLIDAELTLHHLQDEETFDGMQEMVADYFKHDQRGRQRADSVFIDALLNARQHGLTFEEAHRLVGDTEAAEGDARADLGEEGEG